MTEHESSEPGHVVLAARLARWSTPGGGYWPPWLVWHLPCRLTAPRNVLIQRQDGSRWCAPSGG